MKKVLIVIAIIFGVLVIGTGAVAAYDYTILRDLVGLGLPRDLNAAVKKISDNTANLSGYHFKDESKIKATVPTVGVETKSLELPISIEGDYAKPSKEQFTANFKTAGLIDTTLPYISSFLPGASTKNKELISPDLKKQLEEIKIEGIVINENIYLKVPLLFKDTWVETTTKEAVSPSLNNQINTLNYNDYVVDFKKLKDEKVDGVKCYHFQFKLDFDKILSSSLFKDVPSQDLKDAKDALKGSENLIDVYVGKRDLVLHKDKIHFQITSPIKVEFNSEDTLSNFNNAVDITAPPNAKQLDKLTPADLASSPIGKLLLNSSGSDATTRDLQRKTDLKTIQDALKKYAADHKGKYPILTDTSKNGKFLAILVPKYLTKVPVDPLNPEYYYRYKSTDGVHYKLTVTLENKNDPEAQGGIYQLTK